MQLKYGSIATTAFFLNFSFIISTIHAAEMPVEMNDLTLEKLPSQMITQHGNKDVADREISISMKKFSEEELCYFSPFKLLELFSSKQLSPIDVLEAQIKRIELLNPTKISSKHYDEARLQAKESEWRYQNGTQRMHEGIPVLITNDIKVKGWIVDSLPCADDEEIIQLIRNQGVVMHAQTNAVTPALATGFGTMALVSGLWAFPLKSLNQ